MCYFGILYPTVQTSQSTIDDGNLFKKEAEKSVLGSGDQDPANMKHSDKNCTNCPWNIGFDL